MCLWINAKTIKTFHAQFQTTGSAIEITAVQETPKHNSNFKLNLVSYVFSTFSFFIKKVSNNKIV